MRTTFRALLGFVLLLLVTVGIGFGGFRMVQGRMDSNQASGGRGGGFFGSQEPTYTVDLLAFERADYTPMITGFGSITAGRTAELRPLVPGLLQATSDGLIEGAVIRAGMPMFTVDSFSYDIAVKDASIALRDADARLVTARSDLAVEQSALALAQDQLELSEAELARQQELRAQDIVSDAALDNANVVRVADYVAKHRDDFQSIVISLKDTFYHRADGLVGIYRDAEAQCSKTLTIDLERYPRQ